MTGTLSGLVWFKEGAPKRPDACLPGCPTKRGARLLCRGICHEPLSRAQGGTAIGFPLKGLRPPSPGQRGGYQPDHRGLLLCSQEFLKEGTLMKVTGKNRRPRHLFLVSTQPLVKPGLRVL